MRKRETVKRYILLTVALFFIGLGIAFTKHGDIGISPVSSVANVISSKYTFLSFGMWLTVTYAGLLFGQFLLLRRKFKPVYLLQLPMSFLTGYFTDFGLFIAGFFSNDSYISKILLVLLGSGILAFGIALSVCADVILNAGEAFVKALADTTNKRFGDTKVVFDICWVALAVILSLLFFHGKVVGVREGTVISALLVGTIVKLLQTRLEKPLTRLLKK